MDDQQKQDLTKAIFLLERVKEDIDVIRADISKIKDAVYDPDEGIYARLRSLETWKNTSTKIIWIMFTSIAGLVSLGIWQIMFPQLNF
tara:strand:- start:176 stop:439 length:264 start_codon:yes stop_codon:yes gene_type:complete